MAHTRKGHWGLDPPFCLPALPLLSLCTSVPLLFREFSSLYPGVKLVVLWVPS